MNKKTNNRVKRSSAMDWALGNNILPSLCICYQLDLSLERRFTNITILETDLSRLRRKQGSPNPVYLGSWLQLYRINPDVVGWIYQKDHHNQLSIMHGSGNDIYLSDINKYEVRFLWIIGIVLTSLISIRLSMVIICMTAACSSR